MSELIVAAIKIVFLALLWLFIALVADVIRKDLFGKRVSAATLPAADTPRSKRGKRGRDAPPSRFAVSQGNQQGLSVPLEPVINLGRAADSTFFLDDDYASGRHARIYESEGTWMVEDMRSTNGTFLGTTRLTEPREVAVGSVLRIGQTVVELQR